MNNFDTGDSCSRLRIHQENNRQCAMMAAARGDAAPIEGLSMSSPTSSAPEPVSQNVSTLEPPTISPEPSPDQALIEAIMQSAPAPPLPVLAPKVFRLPTIGESIISPNNASRTYTIGAPIGDGSFGYVYRAIDNWDAELAVKIIKPRDRTYEQVLEAARLEAANLVVLRHPRIIYVHDLFEYNDACYIVFEQCGAPVATLLNGEKGGAGLVRPIARCLLEALAYVHDRGYVHQDVHLHNVFIHWTKCEVVPNDDHWAMSFKLGDLGLTKPVEHIDATNTVLAPWMLPPEYLDGTFGRMDHRLDIYHAALLLLQVLVGKPLEFSREDILDGAPRKLAESHWHPVGKVLGIGLRRHVEHRPVNALYFWEQIKLAT